MVTMMTDTEIEKKSCLLEKFASGTTKYQSPGQKTSPRVEFTGQLTNRNTKLFEAPLFMFSTGSSKTVKIGSIPLTTANSNILIKRRECGMRGWLVIDWTQEVVRI